MKLIDHVWRTNVDATILKSLESHLKVRICTLTALISIDIYPKGTTSLSERTSTNDTTTATAGMTTRVVKGSIWTLLGAVLPIGISFVSTPFVIRFLGTESYGVLILVGLIPTYFAFADLGTPTV